MLLENQIYIQDNLEFLQIIPDETINLCYIDPPYFSGRDFGDFTDKWKTRDDYNLFLKKRLQEIKRVLAQRGVVCVHIDQYNSHHTRLLLDEVFGEDRFINEIIWKTSGNAKTKYKFQRSHDTIFVYSKTKEYCFNQEYREYDKEYRKNNKIDVEKDGREYVTSALKNNQPNVNKRENLRYEWKGNNLQWHISQTTMEKLEKEGRLVYSKKSTVPRVKRYLDEMQGIPVRDVWDDISSIQSGEKLDYATQKPIKLLDRIIKSFSNEGELVLDCFSGSGTTGVSCVKNNRKYLLCDINEKSKQIFLDRL